MNNTRGLFLLQGGEIPDFDTANSLVSVAVHSSQEWAETFIP